MRKLSLICMSSLCLLLFAACSTTPHAPLPQPTKTEIQRVDPPSNLLVQCELPKLGKEETDLHPSFWNSDVIHNAGVWETVARACARRMQCLVGWIDADKQGKPQSPQCGQVKPVEPGS